MRPSGHKGSKGRSSRGGKDNEHCQSSGIKTTPIKSNDPEEHKISSNKQQQHHQVSHQRKPESVPIIVKEPEQQSFSQQDSLKEDSFITANHQFDPVTTALQQAWLQNHLAMPVCTTASSAANPMTRKNPYNNFNLWPDLYSNFPGKSRANIFHKAGLSVLPFVVHLSSCTPRIFSMDAWCK